MMRYAIKKVSYIYNESKRIKITSFRAALRFDRLTTVLHYLDSTISPRYPHTKFSLTYTKMVTFAPNPVTWLREQLELPEDQRQRAGITALIDLYETGQLGPLQRGKTTRLCDGRIIDSPLGESRDLPNGVLWAEVSFLFLDVRGYADEL